LIVLMFLVISGIYVDGDVHVGKVISQILKLSIYYNHVGQESMLQAYVVNLFDGLEQCLALLVVQHFCCPKFNVL
jgi:hypothetical protein